MRIFLAPLYRWLILILVLSVVPAYETMSNTRRPSWNSLGRDDLEMRTGTFITIKRDVVFGANVHSYDLLFRERWHRLRLGFPLKPVTIDFEEGKKQVQGRIEINWLLANISISWVLWTLFELMLLAVRRSRANKKA